MSSSTELYYMIKDWHKDNMPTLDLTPISMGEAECIFPYGARPVCHPHAMVYVCSELKQIKCGYCHKLVVLQDIRRIGD